jgi:peptidoglycan/LPS O-acetylase OafA/YrhL
VSPTGRPEPQDRGPLGRFGAPAGQGSQRPSHVLVAAVAGFLEAGLLMLAALAYFLASAREPSFVVFGAVFLGLSLACVLGSVQALRGRNRAVLVVAGGVAAAIALVLIAISVANGAGFNAFSALIVLLGVAAVVLLLQAPSREWFAARRSGRSR